MKGTYVALFVLLSVLAFAQDKPKSKPTKAEPTKAEPAKEESAEPPAFTLAEELDLRTMVSDYYQSKVQLSTVKEEVVREEKGLADQELRWNQKTVEVLNAHKLEPTKWTVCIGPAPGACQNAAKGKIVPVALPDPAKK